MNLDGLAFFFVNFVGKITLTSLMVFLNDTLTLSSFPKAFTSLALTKKQKTASNIFLRTYICTTILE